MTTEIPEVLTAENPRWEEFVAALGQAVFCVPGGTKWVCHHDYQHAELIMTAMGNVDVPASVAYFKDHGGFCDCEILFNVAA